MVGLSPKRYLFYTVAALFAWGWGPTHPVTIIAIAGAALDPWVDELSPHRYLFYAIAAFMAHFFGAIAAATYLAVVAIAWLLAPAEQNNTRSLTINAPLDIVFGLLSDVRNLKDLHVPITRVEVLEDTGECTHAGGAGLTTRTMRWIQHAHWGASKHKRESILSSAVLHPGLHRRRAWVDNLRIKRLDRHFVYMHWAHRFILEEDAADPHVTRLSETESLQSHRVVVLFEQSGFRLHELRRATTNYHDVLFANIKRQCEELFSGTLSPNPAAAASGRAEKAASAE